MTKLEVLGAADARSLAEQARRYYNNHVADPSTPVSTWFIALAAALDGAAEQIDKPRLKNGKTEIRIPVLWAPDI